MFRKLIYGVITVMVVLLSGYFVVLHMVRGRFERVLQQNNIGYSQLEISLLTGSFDIKDIHMHDSTNEIRISHLAIIDAGLIDLIRHRDLHIRRIVLEGCHVSIGQQLPHMNRNRNRPFNNAAIGQIEIRDIHVTTPQAVFTGNLRLDTIHLSGNNDHPQIDHLHLNATIFEYTIPNAYERVYTNGITADSRNTTCQVHIDTVRVTPTVSRSRLAELAGHQIDYATANSEDITIADLDLTTLAEQEFHAASIKIGKSHIHVYRDRRLRLDTTTKPLPIEMLRSLPVTLRIGELHIGHSSFIYEEQPAKGTQTGTLEIVRLHGTIHPLINHPGKGDPRYLSMTMEGSLMGSGTVTSTIKLPLHREDPYLVEGAFQDLDVTALNPPAENLGGIHLESGLLNSLSFGFSMNRERSTGQIVGEYHDLVVQKLKGENKKVDKVKSFFLKHLIIPRDKDRSLPVAKRTGKVDYKHDPARYFSYYMLHSLLVGVKSSFKLGFLLPG